jgi:hypothetical protein
MMSLSIMRLSSVTLITTILSTMTFSGEMLSKMSLNNDTKYNDTVTVLL